MDDKVQNIELPGAWWGTYVTRTGLGCGECDWEHALPTPFVMGDAARVAIGHWEERHAKAPRQLRRMRLPLDSHDSDLLLVGDYFEQGGKYTQMEIPRAESDGWSWLEWDDAYDRLAKAWRNAYLLADGRPVPTPAVEAARDGVTYRIEPIDGGG